MRISYCKHGKINSKLLSIQHFQYKFSGPRNGTKTQADMVNFLSRKKKKKSTPRTLEVRTTDKMLTCVATTTQLNCPP